MDLRIYENPAGEILIAGATPQVWAERLPMIPHFANVKLIASIPTESKGARKLVGVTMRYYTESGRSVVWPSNEKATFQAIDADTDAVLAVGSLAEVADAAGLMTRAVYRSQAFLRQPIRNPDGLRVRFEPLRVPVAPLAAI